MSINISLYIYKPIQFVFLNPALYTVGYLRSLHHILGQMSSFLCLSTNGLRLWTPGCTVVLHLHCPHKIFQLFSGYTVPQKPTSQTDRILGDSFHWNIVEANGLIIQLQLHPFLSSFWPCAQNILALQIFMLPVNQISVLLACSKHFLTNSSGYVPTSSSGASFTRKRCRIQDKILKNKALFNKSVMILTFGQF